MQTILASADSISTNHICSLMTFLSPPKCCIFHALLIIAKHNETSFSTKHTFLISLAASMANAKLAHIYLLMAPLQKFGEKGLGSAIEKTQSSSFSLSPKNFPTFQHWTIQVRKTCYEVVSFDDPDAPNGKRYVMQIVPARSWWQSRHMRNHKVSKVKIGITRWADTILKVEGLLRFPAPQADG
jgi:hypothetical protein